MALTLADVTELIIDTKHATPEYIDKGHPCIRTPNIGRGFFVLDTVRRVSEQTYLQWVAKAVPLPNDLILAREAPVGNVAIVPPRLRPCLGQRTVLIRPVREQVHPRYLMYLLLGDEMQGIMQSLANGATVPHLNMKDIRSLPLPELPRLPSQRKIAGILGAYDDLIENNLRRIQILEEMARLVYREWFVHFRFPGHESVRMVDSPLGKIPEGWEVSWLGGLAEEQRRAVDPALLEPEVPYVGLEHIPRRSVALREWGQANDAHSTKYEFRKGEILFGKIRPYFHKVAVVPMQGICSTDAIVISAKRRAWFPLILSCVASDDFIAYATQTSSGTKMPRANWSVLVEYPIALPPWSLLVRFNSFMETVLAELHNLTYRNRSLRTTRDLLLPRLISGQLDVSDWQTTAEALR